MSSVLTYYASASVQTGGSTVSNGSLAEPVGQVTVTGSRQEMGSLVTVGPFTDSTDAVTVWEWDVDDDSFELIELRIEGDGYLDVWVQVRTPTADDDTTPTGTAFWVPVEMSCFAPFVLSSATHRYNATIATMFGDTGGMPSMLSGSNADGRVYKVVVVNRGEDAVTMRKTVVN